MHIITGDKLRIYLILSLLLSSCISYNKITSFQEIDDNKAAVKNYDQYKMEEYKIRSNDILSIKLNSLESTTTTFFNETESNSQPMGGGINTALLYLSGYIVDLDGNIELPLIGSLKVEGLTTYEVRNIVDEKLKDYLKFASVSVKLANFRVSVFGEVKQPNILYLYEKKVTILHALSLVGGFSDFANQKKVRLIRENEKGTETTFLDFSKPELLTSDYYFLRPNDVIYVEPLKSKAFNINIATAGVFISLVSVIALVANVFVNN